MRDGLTRALRVIALGALAACAAGPGPNGEVGAPPGLIRDEDVLLLPRFSDVTGIAASRRYVFVAGTRGLAIYDAQFNWWLPPRPGVPRVSGMRTAMAADPVADAVWIGGVGEVRYYQPATDFTVRVPIPGVVEVIGFSRTDPGRGAWVRSGGTWLQVTTTGSAMPASSSPGDVVIAPDLAEVYRRFPALRDLGANITRDDRLREWPVTVGTVAPDRSEVFLGTQGNGIYRVDPNFMRGQQLPFGLLSDGAGAVVRASDGIWVAPAGGTSGLRPRGGLTFVRGDLQEWRWIEAERDDLLGTAAANDLALRGSVAWVASDVGVARIDTRASRPQAARWSLLNGLPDDRALAVEPREGGAWVGTARGLAWVSDTGRVQATAARVGETIASGVPVRALLATGDTLWMGTDAGLLLLPPGERRTPVRSALQQQDGRLAGRVSAFASSDSVVVVGLGLGDVVRIDRRNGSLLPRTGAGDLQLAGPVLAMAMDARSLFVVGERGVAAIDRDGGSARFVSLSELGSEAFDVTLTPDAAWVATRAGVVRLSRRAGGLPR